MRPEPRWRSLGVARRAWVVVSVAVAVGAVPTMAQASAAASPAPAAVVEIGSVKPWYPIGRSSATRLLDGRVLFIDGQTARRWDPADGTWSSVGTLGSERAWGFSTTLLRDGRVVVVGGFARRAKAEGSRSFPRDIEVWDPATRAFSGLGRLPEGRTWSNGFVLDDGRVLIVGGSGATRNLRDSVLWDPVDGGVVKGARLPGRMVATGDPIRGLVTADGRMILAGGFADGPGPRILVARVDPVGGVEIVHRMATYGPVIPYALPDGRVLLVGEGREVGSTLLPGSRCEGHAAIAVMDVVSGEVTDVASLDGPLGSVQTPDGSVVVVAGTHPMCDADAAGVDGAEVSRWSAMTGALETIGMIPVPMAAPMVATLADGSVLVAGDTQLWRVDPAVGSIAHAGDLPATERPWTELVPLLDGRALIVNEDGTVLLWTQAGDEFVGVITANATSRLAAIEVAQAYER